MLRRSRMHFLRSRQCIRPSRAFVAANRIRLLCKGRKSIARRCPRSPVPHRAPARTETTKSRRRAITAIPRRCSRAAGTAFLGHPIWPRLARRAYPCPGSSTPLSSERKRSITGSVRCISRISEADHFEIFCVGPPERYIMLQNRMSLAPAVGYSGVYGEFGPHSCRRR